MRGGSRVRGGHLCLEKRAADQVIQIRGNQINGRTLGAKRQKCDIPWPENSFEFTAEVRKTLRCRIMM